MNQSQISIIISHLRSIGMDQLRGITEQAEAERKEKNKKILNAVLGKKVTVKIPKGLSYGNSYLSDYKDIILEGIGYIELDKKLEKKAAVSEKKMIEYLEELRLKLVLGGNEEFTNILKEFKEFMRNIT